MTPGCGSSSFVLASTSEVDDDPEGSPQPETYRGRARYDEGKRFAEALTVAYGRVHGLDARIERSFSTRMARGRRSTTAG